MDDEIVRILKDLIFIKTENTDSYVIYTARISSTIGNDDKFIFVYVPIHVALTRVSYIKDLLWSKIHTCTRRSYYTKNLNKQRWDTPTKGYSFIYDTEGIYKMPSGKSIKITISDYTNSFPINLTEALQTFCCTIYKL